MLEPILTLLETTSNLCYSGGRARDFERESLNPMEPSDERRVPRPFSWVCQQFNRILNQEPFGIRSEGLRFEVPPPQRMDLDGAPEPDLDPMPIGTTACLGLLDAQHNDLGTFTLTKATPESTVVVYDPPLRQPLYHPAQRAEQVRQLKEHIWSQLGVSVPATPLTGQTTTRQKQKRERDPMNSGGNEKINRVIDIRAKYLLRERVTIGRARACLEANTTVWFMKQHAPEIMQRWDDPKFKPKHVE